MAFNLKGVPSIKAKASTIMLEKYNLYCSLFIVISFYLQDYSITPDTHCQVVNFRKIKKGG